MIYFFRCVCSQLELGVCISSAFPRFYVTISNKSIYSVDRPSHSLTQKAISWPGGSLLESKEHGMPGTALFLTWGKVLSNSIRQISSCPAHTAFSKAPGHTQLDVNQEFIYKLVNIPSKSV